MTTLKEVTTILESIDREIAKQWINNDIIKMKLATSYDDWINDINDHHLFLTLEEHIEYIIDNPSLIDPTI